MSTFHAPTSLTTPTIGVSSSGGQSDPLFNSLTEESIAQIRAQLLSLEERFGHLQETSRAHSLLDETYRAAHGLRMSVDPDRAPQVQRLAQLLQGVVQAVRTGSLVMRQELAVLLATVVRITRESLDLSVSGGPAPAAAGAAIEALQEVLARPGSWAPPPSLGKSPPRFTHVETHRLRSAGDAARQAVRASESFQRTALEAGSMAERLREMIRKQESAVRELREAIPGGLAAAARGEPATEITTGLVALIADLGRIPESLAGSLDKLPMVMGEAAAAGARATASAAEAVRQLECVKVSSLLEGVPERVKRSMKRLGVTARVEMAVGEHEIEAPYAELLRTAVGAGIRALTLPAPFTGKRLTMYSVERAAGLAVHACDEGGRLRLRLSWSGDRPEEEHVLHALASVQRHLEEAGGGLEADCGARGGATVTVSLPLPSLPGKPAGEYIVVRAGDSAYAILSRDVVRFVEADTPPCGPSRSRKGPGPVRLSPVGTPTTGVLVHAGSRDAVLLVDEIEGREMLAQGAAGDGAAPQGYAGSMAIRANGEAIPILDTAAFIRDQAPHRVHKRKDHA